jgi:hypothetical protein
VEVTAALANLFLARKRLLHVLPWVRVGETCEERRFIGRTAVKSAPCTDARSILFAAAGLMASMCSFSDFRTKG